MSIQLEIIEWPVWANFVRTLKIGELKPTYVLLLKLNANLTILRHATETLDDFQTFPL